MDNALLVESNASRKLYPNEKPSQVRVIGRRLRKYEPKVEIEMIVWTFVVIMSRLKTRKVNFILIQNVFYLKIWAYQIYI